MVENTKLWREENADVTVESELPNMRSVGVTAGGIQPDLDQFTPPETADEGGETKGGGEEGGAGEVHATGTDSLTQAGATPNGINTYMLLFELQSTEKTEEKQWLQDNTALRLDDTRKTRITFEQLSKLRKLIDIKAAEYQSTLKLDVHLFHSFSQN